MHINNNTIIIDNKLIFITLDNDEKQNNKAENNDLYADDEGDSRSRSS